MAGAADGDTIDTGAGLIDALETGCDEDGTGTDDVTDTEEADVEDCWARREAIAVRAPSTSTGSRYRHWAGKRHEHKQERLSYGCETVFVCSGTCLLTTSALLSSLHLE